MRIIGCDFHTGQQTLAMLDTETGELVKMTLLHEGNTVREFYSALHQASAILFLGESKPSSRTAWSLVFALTKLHRVSA
jgi:hypothetical protein